MQTIDYARWFRGSTPYISAHRGKTFVVLLPGEALEHINLTNIIHDLALLHVLGVRVVLVHGARPQITASSDAPRWHAGQRITNDVDMRTVSRVCGELRTRLEALFSTGLPNSPMHNVDIAVVSGNFVTAQPVGVLDGVDHLFTGAVRRVETQRIAHSLDHGGLILQSPIGFSPSGQVFNLSSDGLAAQVAIALNADKLIVFNRAGALLEADVRISSMTPASAKAHAADAADANTPLGHMADAVHRGVEKAHLVSYEEDGALLAELFTADGVGTQITQQEKRDVRPATLDDVAAIVEIIRPLEEQGVLVRRERDRLEQEIGHFMVAEIDSIVVGCCAVYPYGDQGELACVAVHENYRQTANSGIGRTLLQAAEQRAQDRKLKQLFALTTQARDWFIEQGFEDASPDVLPQTKQSLYNWQRNSRVVLKAIH